MVKHATEKMQARARTPTRRKSKPKTKKEDESILQAATIHLIRKVGGLFVATEVREERKEVGPRWIITVTLRYPTGHEGYVGDLSYDGKNFTMLTEDSVIDERVRQIGADPEGIRLWNEYRDSTLRAGKV
jgi:hypothetical protein